MAQQDPKIIFSMNGVGKVLPHNNKVILKEDQLNRFYSPIQDDEIERFFAEARDGKRKLNFSTTTDKEAAYKFGEIVVIATPTYSSKSESVAGSSLPSLENLFKRPTSTLP